MAQHEYKCQSCFHRDVCPEYHPETYSCVHHVDEADVAPRAAVAREVFEELEQESFGYADEDGDWFCIYEKDYAEIKKKHLAATGTNEI